MKKLLDIMRTLRSDKGCPWDQQQTFETLKEFTIEEAYEVIDAIDSKDPSAHCEELGDLLLQIAFQAVIAEEEELFDYEDVEKGICSKLITRHPHVFGEEKAESAQDVLKLWNSSKKKEKGSVLDSIPSKLPALMKASKMIKRLHATSNNIEEKLGNEDLNENELIGKELFDIVLKAKEKDIDPEFALQDFLKKISRMEERSDG
ncbi:MAG: nucleoside triphosphate pyrophosphohydrolase [Candidatus Muiribacterium halophilum]|uniref:Nucleoside triphosphate pyrophosphohydrolase n=1 Tax=Muiribacterium halophilum TaxID=2053465 RepID=A0A2N5ZAM4_MUIH1|nr:MAG: nucleoside triphosphate pyrophosphohydrolase [Candidatus Muirbacterium halophilum]